MKKNHQASIQEANEVIRRNMQARRIARSEKQGAKVGTTLETLNCANAFARNGKNIEHLFDKLF